MKRKTLIIAFIAALFILIYTIFDNSEEWSEINLIEIKAYEKDFPYLKSQERIMESLSKVQYAAIVYPTKNRVYPNSIFHKYILGNPKESTSYLIQAKVLYTVIGEPVNSITYGSSGGSMGSSAIFVGLCKTENGFYAPDNGYEFPATQEAIEFVKSLDIKDIKDSATPACKN